MTMMTRSNPLAGHSRGALYLLPLGAFGVLLGFGVEASGVVAISEGRWAVKSRLVVNPLHKLAVHMRVVVNVRATVLIGHPQARGLASYLSHPASFSAGALAFSTALNISQKQQSSSRKMQPTKRGRCDANSLLSRANWPNQTLRDFAVTRLADPKISQRRIPAALPNRRPWLGSPLRASALDHTPQCR